MFSLKRTTLIGVGLMLLLVPRAYAGAVVGPVADPFGNDNLYIVSISSWAAAENQAEVLGGHLVTIHSSAENQFIVNAFNKDFTSVGGPNLTTAAALWIGLYDPTGESKDDGPGGPTSQHAANFVWADGQVSTYRNWNGGEPSDSNDDEYYGTMWAAGSQSLGGGPLGTWNDGTAGLTANPFYGIAEVVVAPEPTSLGLLGLGAMGLLSRRRRA